MKHTSILFAIASTLALVDSQSTQLLGVGSCIQCQFQNGNWCTTGTGVANTCWNGNTPSACTANQTTPLQCANAQPCSNMAIGSSALTGQSNYTLPAFTECAFNLTNQGTTGATIIIPNIPNLWVGQMDQTSQTKVNTTLSLTVAGGNTSYVFFWNNNTDSKTFSLSWSEPASSQNQLPKNLGQLRDLILEYSANQTSRMILESEYLYIEQLQLPFYSWQQLNLITNYTQWDTTTLYQWIKWYVQYHNAVVYYLQNATTLDFTINNTNTDNNVTSDMNSTIVSTQFQNMIHFNSIWDSSFNTMPASQVTSLLKYNVALYETYAFYILIFQPPNDIFDINNNATLNASFPAVNLTEPYDQDGVNAFLSIDTKIKEQAEQIEDEMLYESTYTYGLDPILAWINQNVHS